jgi:hypothetical protein
MHEHRKRASGRDIRMLRVRFENNEPSPDKKREKDCHRKQRAMRSRRRFFVDHCYDATGPTMDGEIPTYPRMMARFL